MLAMHYTDLDKKKKESAIKEALDELSLLHKLKSTVNELSGGEKQRVAIARTMLKPGDLILADEPTVSLDARMANIVMDSLIAAVNAARKTLVVVTHDMLMASKCNRVLNMGDGNLI